MVQIPSRPQEPSGDPAVEFTNELRDYGLDVKGIVSETQGVVRVPDLHHKNGRNKVGYYVFHGDWGVYGSWVRDGEHGVTWQSKRVDDLPFAERMARNKQIEAEREAIRERLQAEQASQAEVASAVVARLPDATPFHPYLQAKGVSYITGIKERGDELIVPIYDIETSTMISYQAITTAGKKFMPGARSSGGHFWVGSWEGPPPSPIYIAEGYATAATIYAATGVPCCVAFTAGNLLAVASGLRKRLQSNIVICADNDDSDTGWDKAQLTAKAVDSCTVVMCPQPGDFNDLGVGGTQVALVGQLSPNPIYDEIPFKETTAPTLEAFGKPFVRRMPPKRPWLFGDQLLRGYVTGILAPPGVGKSTITIQIALSICAGLDWADWHCHQKGNVWIWNNEDDQDEMTRRILAAEQAMGLPIGEIDDKLFINTGDERALTVAKADPRTGVVTITPDVDRCIQFIRENQIVCMIVDPFAETHSTNENSNDDIKQVTAAFRQIAKQANCAMVLVHHTRKQSSSTPGDMDAGRGAGAFTGVARVVSTLFGMTKADGENYGLPPDDHHRYVRYDGAKANLSFVSGKAKWFERTSIDLENGDTVGVLRPWSPPDTFDGINEGHMREVHRLVAAAYQGGEPFGRKHNTKNPIQGVIADVCALDRSRQAKRIEGILETWVQNGVLQIVHEVTKTSNRREVAIIKPGVIP